MLHSFPNTVTSVFADPSATGHTDEDSASESSEGKGILSACRNTLSPNACIQYVSSTSMPQPYENDIYGSDHHGQLFANIMQQWRDMRQNGGGGNFEYRGTRAT